MASNNYTSANIVPSADTFREWVDLTNRITYDMEKYVVSTTLTAEGACTTGNSFVNGHFSANTLRVVDVVMGASPNSTVFGTEAVTSNLNIGTNTVFVANDTHDSIIYAQSNVFLVNTGASFVANSDGGFITINSIVNTFTSNAQNIDINAQSLDVQDGNVTISSNVTVNSTATAVRFDANTDINANVDIDNALTTITSTNTVIENGQLNITSNVNIDAVSVDIEDGELNISSNVTINSTATAFTSNAATNIFNTKIDANANVDIDNALTTITSSNTVVENGEFNITSNVNFDAASFDVAGGELTISSNVTVNSSANAVVIDAPNLVFSGNTTVGNVDVDAALVHITSANVTVNAGELNITSNVNFDAASFDILAGAFNVTQSNSTTHSINIDPTANTFTSNAGLNVFNTPIDANANVDIDNALTTITSSNTVVENGQFNITSNVNFDAASFDILAGAFNVTQSNSTTHSINIDPTANTFTSNAGLNIFNTPLDINANIDVDNTTTDFNSTNFIVTGTTANVTSTTLNIHGTSLDIDSNTNIDGILTTTANATIGNANTDVLTVNSNTVLEDKLNVKKAADFDSTLNVDGDVTLNANTTIGSNTSDGVAINSVITTNVVPDGNTRVLGGTAARWSTIYGVDGNFTSDVTIGDDLTVSGNTALGSNTSDGVTFNALVHSSFLPANSTLLLGNTSNRWVVAATTINANADITAGADVDITSQANTNTLRVRSTSELTGAVNANTSVTTGNVSITRSQISVGNSSANVVISQNGNIAIDGTLDVDSNTAANSTSASIVTDGGLLTKKNIYSTGSIETADALTVDKLSTLNGNVELGSNTSDVVSVNGLVDTGVTPSTNGTLSLGTTTARWIVKANTIDAASTVTVGGDIDQANSTEANVYNVVVRNDATIGGNTTVGSNTSDGVTFNALVHSGFLPANNSGLLLGNTANRWVVNAKTINASDTITGTAVNLSGAANVNTLRVRSTSDFEGDVTIGNSSVFVAVDESEGDLDVTGWSNSTFQSKSSFRRNLVVGNNVGGNTTLTLTVGPAGQNLINAVANTWEDWGTVTLSSEATGGKVAAANAQFATLTVTDSASLPSNTTLSIATANTNDLFVFNKAEFTGKANGDNYIKVGTTSEKVSLNLANASFTTSIFSANTDQNIGSSSAKWGSGYFNSAVQIGSFTSGTSGTQANSSAVESTNIYARADLVAKYSSDERLKDNLIVIDTAINKVEALSGYEFTWNDKINDFRIGTQDYGILAQELEQVLPHAVQENVNGYKSVNYNSLIPLLIEAVKELSERLKKLEGEAE